MTTDPRVPPPERDHYSYSHYASQQVAEGFDALRFSGDVGRFLARSQAALLAEALHPREGQRIADVGTGTGRAAIGLAARGAAVIGLDASPEMLGVARLRAADANVPLVLAVADAHALPLGDAEVDAAVCLRVLMHAIDWRRCLAELCRVSRHRVVVDFPAALSFAALESLARRARRQLGHRVEAYRVIPERDVAIAFEACGFRVVDVRRQFVLPIAVHKAVGRFGATRRVEHGLEKVGALRLLGSPVTMVAER